MSQSPHKTHIKNPNIINPTIFNACAMFRNLAKTGVWRRANRVTKIRFSTSNTESAIAELLLKVANGSVSTNEAEIAITDMGILNAKGKSPDESLSSFANLDHRRSSRTGFPEVRLQDHYWKNAYLHTAVSNLSNFSCSYLTSLVSFFLSRQYSLPARLLLRSQLFLMIWQVMWMN